MQLEHCVDKSRELGDETSCDGVSAAFIAHFAVTRGCAGFADIFAGFAVRKCETLGLALAVLIKASTAEN